MNYKALFPNADIPALEQFLDEKKNWLAQPKKGFIRYREPLEKVGQIKAQHLDVSGDTVIIGNEDEISKAAQKEVQACLRNLMPWRKGPFSVFGIDIDSEWRSQRKWNRIVPELPDLKGKVIADIGCNNGYYMFRMAQAAPKAVLGFEPYVHHYYAFHTLNAFARLDMLNVELLGIEHLHFFPESFDLIFCLGILYHRPSPIQSLKDMYDALQPGGMVIVESQAIPGEESMALFPENTYAKVPGTWFVPTASCLANWMKRAGFDQVRLFCTHPMSSEEQRKTEWMIFESYEDFIDKHNPAYTIEGYPAPLRVFFKATKG